MLIRISIPGVMRMVVRILFLVLAGIATTQCIWNSSGSSVKIDYSEEPYQFTDGESYSLRRPTYTLEAPYITLPADVMLSPRVAPPVFGLGLLEAVDEREILSRADENDADGDGISEDQTMRGMWWRTRDTWPVRVEGC